MSEAGKKPKGDKGPKGGNPIEEGQGRSQSRQEGQEGCRQVVRLSGRRRETAKDPNYVPRMKKRYHEVIQLPR